jgi:hypothetical protein
MNELFDGVMVSRQCCNADHTAVCGIWIVATREWWAWLCWIGNHRERWWWILGAGWVNACPATLEQRV